MRFVILGEDCECSQSQPISLPDLLKRRQEATSAWIDVFESPLQKACTCSQLEIVKLQLQELTRPNQTTEVLALDIAAGNGNLETIDKLCTANPDLLHQKRPDPYGLAIPVVRASNAGHKEVTRYLYDITPAEVLIDEGIEGYWATCLLQDAIFNGFLGKSLSTWYLTEAVISHHWYWYIV